MADIKSFTGFIAPDNTTHTTFAKAVEHTKTLKVIAALEAAFNDSNFNHDTASVSEGENGYPCVYASSMPAFLLANREKILACFNQTVQLRAPAKSRKKDASKTVAIKSAPAPAVSREASPLIPLHTEALVDLDE